MSRNKIITIASILTFIGSIYYYTRPEKLTPDEQKTRYIENCVDDFESDRYTLEEKRSACSCSHSYFFSKYGEVMYDYESFVPTRQDTLKILDCFLSMGKNIDLGLDVDTLMQKLKEKELME